VAAKSADVLAAGHSSLSYTVCGEQSLRVVVLAARKGAYSVSVTMR
jgi:hypothetical protein